MRTCIRVAVRNRKSDGLANSNKGSGVSSQENVRMDPAALARLKAACHTDELVSLLAYQGLDFSNSDLEGLGLEEFWVDDCHFKASVLDGARALCWRVRRCRFDGASLNNLCMFDSRIEDSVFAYAMLRGAELADVTLGGCDFTDAELVNARLENCHLLDTNFRQANLLGVCFTGSHFERVDFTEADCTNADFRGCRFTEVNWTSAILEGAQFDPGVHPEPRN